MNSNSHRIVSGFLSMIQVEILSAVNKSKNETGKKTTKRITKLTK